MANERQIKIFDAYQGRLFNVRECSSFRVLGCLLELMPENDCAIYLTPKDRADAMRRTSLSSGAFSRALRLLAEYGIVLGDRYEDEDGKSKRLRGGYIINPVMFWYGDLRKRANAIKKYGELFGYRVE